MSPETSLDRTAGTASNLNNASLASGKSSKLRFLLSFMRSRKMNFSCDDDSASVNAFVVRLADGKRTREQTDLLQIAFAHDQASLPLSRTSSCDSTRTGANVLVIHVVARTADSHAPQA